MIKIEKKQVLDTSHQTAFNFAKEKSYDYLITLDADLSHDPKIIPNFIDQLEDHVFVIGSRYIKDGKSEMKLRRYLLSLIGNKFIKFVLNIPSNEFTTSYRGFNLTKLDNFDLKEINSTDLFNNPDEKVVMLENLRFYVEEEENDKSHRKKF